MKSTSVTRKSKGIATAVLAGMAATWAALGPAGALAAGESKARVERSLFGQTSDGAEVHLYTLTNAGGWEAQVMTLGATLVCFKMPDRHGKLDNVTLRLDALDDYLRGHPLFGSVVGRYANRIAGAKFTIDGVEHKLTPNAGPHHIHGGSRGAFHRAVWDASPVHDSGGVAVRLTHVSPDGDEGYPGKLRATVTYRLTDDNELVIDYAAQTDRPTHVNLTNHAYWNLGGAGSGDVLGHELLLGADRYLPADKAKIPTGEVRDVRGTPMDFTTARTIGSRIDQVEDRNYDHCYVVRKGPGQDRSLAARLSDPRSGRVMEVWTTQPGFQLYTAKGLSDRLKAEGKPYGPYHGVCIETQHYPDAPNRPQFPSTLLRPGETYRQVTVHRFKVEKP